MFELLPILIFLFPLLNICKCVSILVTIKEIGTYEFHMATRKGLNSCHGLNLNSIFQCK